MKLAVYLPLILPLLAAVSARRLAEWLPPRSATWLLTGSAVVLAAASSAVLALLALAATIRIPLVAAVADLSMHALSREDPSSLPLGLAAGALLAAAAAGAARAAWRRTSALVDAHRQARWLPGAEQVVVVSDEAADAYTAPGWPGRIVITTGMVHALTAAERRVLLAHERAHASGYHYLFTAAARLAWPLTRCCARWPPPSVTAWNGGPTSRPRPRPETGGWPPAPSPRRRWPRRRLPRSGASPPERSAWWPIPRGRAAQVPCRAG